MARTTGDINFSTREKRLTVVCPIFCTSLIVTAAIPLHPVHLHRMKALALARISCLRVRQSVIRAACIYIFTYIISSHGKCAEEGRGKGTQVQGKLPE